MDRKERAAQLEAAIDGAISDLEASMAQGQSETFLQALEWWSRFHSYSFNNALLILLQKPDAIQVAGYKAWEKLGYHVRQGEHALWIRGPWMRKEIDPVTGEVTERLVGYIPLAVFDISQTAEWPEKQPPEPIRPATGAEWESLYQQWTSLLTTQGFTVREGATGSAYGIARGNEIIISRSLDVAHKAPVLLHELAHIVAGHTAAKEEKSEEVISWTLQDRECQVEASAYVLCRMLGADHPAAADYLLNYKVDAGKLRSHLDIISSVVRRIRKILQFDSLSVEQMAVA